MKSLAYAVFGGVLALILWMILAELIGVGQDDVAQAIEVATIVLSTIIGFFSGVLVERG